MATSAAGSSKTGVFSTTVSSAGSSKSRTKLSSNLDGDSSSVNAICVAGTSLSEVLLSSGTSSTGFSAGVSSILKSASADFSNKPPNDSSAGAAGFTLSTALATDDSSAGFSSILKSASADFSNKLPKESSSASSSKVTGAAFSATGSSTTGSAGAANSAAGSSNLSSNLKSESFAAGFSKDSSGRSSSPKMEENASLTFVSGSSAFGASATLGASSTTGDSSTFGVSSNIKGSSVFGVSSKLSSKSNRLASALSVSASSSENSMCIGEAALSAGFSAGSSAT